MSRFKEFYRDLYQTIKFPCDDCKTATEYCFCGRCKDAMIRRQEVLQAELLHVEADWIRRERINSEYLKGRETNGKDQ